MIEVCTMKFYMDSMLLGLCGDNTIFTTLDGLFFMVSTIKC